MGSSPTTGTTFLAQVQLAYNTTMNAEFLKRKQALKTELNEEYSSLNIILDSLQPTDDPLACRELIQQIPLSELLQLENGVNAFHRLVQVGRSNLIPTDYRTVELYSKRDHKGNTVYHLMADRCPRSIPKEHRQPAIMSLRNGVGISVLDRLFASNSQDILPPYYEGNWTMTESAKQEWQAVLKPFNPPFTILALLQPELQQAGWKTL